MLGFNPISSQPISSIDGALALSAETGAFVLTGNPAVLDLGLTAGTGVFLVSGQDADLKHSNLIVAETGVFTVSGQAAVLGVGLNVEAGVFVVTGYPVSLPCTVFRTIRMIFLP
jgi:hypothetical protein